MGTTHLERTAQDLRLNCISDAEVLIVEDASDTVKIVTVKVEEKAFGFKAGQWVDTMIPGLEMVGGFSMWTSPKQLEREGTLGLAIKNSDHPPARWVHEECKPSSKVKVRVGGDKIIHDPGPEETSSDILLIAGGIGINPLFSILNHVRDLHEIREKDEGVCYKPGRVELLYSASSIQELIFKETIENIMHQHQTTMSAQFFVTKADQSAVSANQLNGKILAHRISKSSIQDALRNLELETLKCFICGPPPMIADMEKYLYELNVEESKIHTEKW